MDDAERGHGLYLHVPFCRHRCGYCDFNVVTGTTAEDRQRYVEALHADLVRTAAAGPAAVAPPGTVAAGASWPTFTSAFVGGGTPTLLPAAALAGLLDAARARLPLADDAEVCTEANPEGLDEAYVRALVDAGLTRISIGAQSFAGSVLAFLDRDHDPDLPLAAVAAARAAGVRSVNLDLLYGAPAETEQDWERSLQQALAAGTDHVSCYALTLEPGTTYAARVRQGVQPPPDDDVGARRMAVADDVLRAAGFVRYELSNWARPGHESRHNRTYWRHGGWLGVGAGAHGHWAGRRWWNLRSAQRYADAVLAGASPVAGEEVPTREELRLERLLLGLRLVEGVERAAVEPVDDAVVAGLVGRGLLEVADADGAQRLRLTSAGFPLAHEVVLRLAG